MKQPAPAISASTLSDLFTAACALFTTDADAAERQAADIVKSAPGERHALALMVSACRLKGDLEGARALLTSLAKAEPNLAAIQYEFGNILMERGETDQAIGALSRAVELEPVHPSAWRALGDAYSKLGKQAEAAAAYGKHFAIGSSEVREIESAALGGNDRLPHAEQLLRAWLQVSPTDVWARRLLGSVFIRRRAFDEAERQLSQALSVSPNLPNARWMLAGTFYHRGMWERTVAEIETLLAQEPAKREYLDLKAYALLHMGQSDTAIATYEAMLGDHPTAEGWRAYGYALKSVGRQQDAIAAYRQAIALKPNYGIAYWLLASLKSFRFEQDEIEAIKATLKRTDLTAQNRARLHFALGKALEDQRQHAESFEQYRQANAAVRGSLPQFEENMGEFVRRTKAVFTREFYQQRDGWGSASPGPIFVVGLPRSGTTLIEQILASHSQVEGAGELQVLDGVAKRLSQKQAASGEPYPELLQSLGRDDTRTAGEEYLGLTRQFRTLDRTFFVDKMPTNFLHLGLLLLVLPKAKVIDVRRHPLSSGFAIYRHYFQEGYSFAFDLEDIGRYYRSYVELMAHFDAVLPGRIHRVHYERMVSDTESEIRKLLAYCGLPFEESCLSFHKTQRTVLTPSSEQVRQPVFKDAAESWRAYEPWLGPLKRALGNVLDVYPDVPNFSQAARRTDFQWRISAPESATFIQSIRTP